jgi:hypothetical protein
MVRPQAGSGTDMFNQNVVSANFASNADMTLTAAQYSAEVIRVTDSGVVLTTQRNVIFPAQKKTFYVSNLTAQTLVFKTASVAGVTVPAGKKARLWYTGAAVEGEIENEGVQGSVVTAANNLSLATTADYFQVDGATQINLIASTGRIGGSIVTLKFNSTPTVKHGQATSGVNKQIKLAGAADFVASADDTLTLRYDSTDSVWYEMSRAVI